MMCVVAFPENRWVSQRGGTGCCILGRSAGLTDWGGDQPIQIRSSRSKKNQGPTWLVVDLPLVGNILLMVNMVIIWLMMVNNILVGGWPTPLKIHGLRQLGWWHSQLNGKIKNVPTHQPATNSYQCFNGLLSREKHTPKKKNTFWNHGEQTMVLSSIWQCVKTLYPWWTSK